MGDTQLTARNAAVLREERQCGGAERTEGTGQYLSLSPQLRTVVLSWRPPPGAPELDHGTFCVKSNAFSRSAAAASRVPSAATPKRFSMNARIETVSYCVWSTNPFFA